MIVFFVLRKFLLAFDLFYLEILHRRRHLVRLEEVL
jgi:hypothetical protein